MKGERMFLGHGGIFVILIALSMLILAYSEEYDLSSARLLDLVAILLIGLSAAFYGFHRPKKGK